MTRVFCVAALAAILAYDIFAVIHGGTHNTISYEILKDSHQYIIIPFAAGVLCGHLFWSQEK